METNSISVEAFLSKYPNIFNYENNILNPYGNKNFNDVIVSKKEFADLKLPKLEQLHEKGRGELYSHQKIISRFISSFTPYNELLLFHEMGTGKTCTVISVIETFKNNKSLNSINGAVFFAKGESLLQNFLNELLFACTDGRYIPENYNQLTSLQKTYAVRKIISQFYSLHTFETFAKELFKLSDINIIQRYSNKILVLDEVHNLREKSDDKQIKDLQVYQQFHRLFHIVKECKILLLSGSGGMKDDPSEFASVLNLILPLHEQLPTGNAFTKTFFGNDNKLLDTSLLEHAIRGRVSYLKAMSSDVKKVFVGSTIGKLKHFIVYPLEMSPFQTKVYKDAYALDESEKNIYLNTRQALLFAFPNESYGTAGFLKYVIVQRIERENKVKVFYRLHNELIKSINYSLSNLYMYSSKFAFTIETLLQNPTFKALVYCEYVNGGGCILFAKILELFGYKEATGNEKQKGLRYALLTNQTTTPKKIQSLIARFNDPDNIDGEYISVIIGSKVVAEGLTFKNIRLEFIFTPHWNYSETSQVIARGWRLGSHNDLIKRGDKNIQVNIYQLTSLQKDTQSSIDLVMYEMSEGKDILMKKIEYLVKTHAFDCALNEQRNKINGYDNQRECDYDLCDYKCNGVISQKLDTSTYNLFYGAYEEIVLFLTNHFRKHFTIHMSEIESHFPSMTKFEIISALNTIILDSVQFRNKYGFISYLRIRNLTLLYVTIDPKTLNNDVFVNYYNKNLIIQNGDSFYYLLKQLTTTSIPQTIQTIFDYPLHTRQLLSSLPNTIQLLLLQSCIQAKLQNIEHNNIVRLKILEVFKGFYDKIENLWTVWLYKDEFGIFVLQETTMDSDFNTVTGRWVPITENKLVEEYIQQKKTHFTNSPIGFYGLYNPHLNEFCLRETKEPALKDLRKLSIGRRCSDWAMPVLVDIIARRIALEIPDDSFNMGFEELKKHSKVLKEQKYLIPADYNNEQQFQKVLYWAKFSRIQICNHIRQWLTKNGYVEENFDCGTQKKQRGKFIGKD